MKQYRISRRLGAVFLCFALMTGIFQPEVFAEETEVTEGASQCICETLCTEGNIRSDCPVCGAKDADLSLCGSEALNAAYEQVQAAYEAYDNLTDEQKAQVTGADFDALFAVFDSITDVSENTGDFIVTGDASGYSYDAETHVLTVNDGADITISGTTTQDHIVVADSAAAAITLNGVDIQFSDGSASYGSADETDAGTCALSVENNASLILNLSGENTLKSGAGRAGIHVAENASLTIRGDGKLTVTGGNCAAGIGGGLWNNAGNITIEGGTIEATGGSDGAGIGGGHANDALINGQSHRYGGFQSISITGGTVTARSPGNGAGIGTGCWSAQAGTISMENAIVTVSTAGTAGTCAAIGQGYHGSNSAEKVSIKITGSVITATNVNGAQISGGEDPATIENSLVAQGAFSANNYTAYGTYTLPGDFILAEDKTLTIGTDAAIVLDGHDLVNEGSITNSGTLTVSANSTLTNAAGGTIENNGTIDGTGTVVNSGMIAGSANSAISDSVTVTGNSVINPDRGVYPYLDENGAPKASPSGTVVLEDGTITEWGNSGSTTWYIASGTVTIEGQVSITGDVRLILADDCNLTIKENITASHGSLTIYAQSHGSNAGLFAVKSDITGSAGNSGSEGEVGGTLSLAVSGGIVTVSGNIAGGNGGNGSNEGNGGDGGGLTLTVSGGSLTVSGNIVGGNGGNGKNGGNGGELTLTVSGGIFSGPDGTGGQGGKGEQGGNNGSDGNPTNRYNNCIHFLNNTYTVIGDATLSTDLTVNEDEKLDVPENATMTVPAGVTLTINGGRSGDGRIIYEDGVTREGSGTEENPYQIPDLITLEYYRGLINSSSTNIIYGKKYYKLTGDIDMSVKYGEGKLSWTPIGNSDNRFCGYFDGNGYMVNGLYINDGGDGSGLFGYINSATIESLGVSGKVRGNNYVGGIVGVAEGNSRIINCYNTCSAAGSGYIGGIVGELNGSNCSNCYNTGAISGSNYVGGIAGNAFGGTVANCYNIGEISGDNAGGIVGTLGSGLNSGVASECYFLDGTAKNGAGTGASCGKKISTDDLASQSTFTSWNFGDTDPVWQMNSILGRPVLVSNPEGGNGDENSPYEIRTAADLRAFASAVNGGENFSGQRVILTQDIDLENQDWTPIGTDSSGFCGTFSGGGYTISGLCMNGSNLEYTGLFGYIDAGGRVEDVRVLGEITVGRYVGGIAGANSGTVSRCSFSGSVAGTACVGGVVGRLSGGSVINCCSTGEVTSSGSDSYAGGVAGQLSGGSVINCCSTGKVTSSGGAGSAGGVAGENPNSGTITNCYYLAAGESDDTGSGAGKTQAQFASGEVARLLQNGQETDSETGAKPQVWGQTLTGEAPDASPVLTGDPARAVLTVTFQNAGTVHRTAYTNPGGTVSLPSDPTAPDGKYFTGWKSGTSDFTASTTVNTDLTVAAAFADKSHQEAPAAPTWHSSTTESITIKTVIGQKYICKTSNATPATTDSGWTEPVTSSTHTFSNLSAGTIYYIWTYLPGGEQTLDSDVSSALIAYTAPQITTDSSLTAATVGQSYSVTLEATAAESNPVTWKLTEGSTLPAGLTLDENTGTIKGTPTAATDLNGTGFTIIATVGSGGNAASSERTFTLVVNQGTPDFGTLTVTNKGQASDKFVYGDTITISGTITASSAAPSNDGMNAVIEPQQNTVGLYVSENENPIATASVVNGSFTLTYDTSGKDIKATGQSQTFTVRYGGSDDLTDGSATVQITLKKKPVTASLGGATEKVYDGTTSTSGVTIGLENVLEHDSVTASAASITYDTADVGTNKTITASGITLGGTHADYYTLESSTATTAGSITRSGSGLSAAATEDNLIYGETLEIKVTPSATGQAPSGNALALPDEEKDIVELYNGENPLAGTSVKNNDGTYTMTYDTADKGLSVGSNELTVKFNGDTNLAAGETKVTVTLSKKDVTASVSGTPTKTYDGDAEIVVDLIVNDPETGDSLTGIVTGSFADANAGENKAITLDGKTIEWSDQNTAGFYNITLPSSVTGSITRSGSGLSAAATEDNLIYGETMEIKVTPSATGQAPSGNALALPDEEKDIVELYNGENLLAGTSVKNNDGTYTMTYDTADKGLSVGSNELTVKFNGDTNLAAGETKVTVTLSKKDVTASVSGTPTKVYDGKTDIKVNLDFTEEALSGTDSLTGTVTGSFADANAGENKAIMLDGKTVEWSDQNTAGFYNITLPTNVTGSITPADIDGTVTISGDAVYGQTLTAGYTGNADSVTWQWYRNDGETTEEISGATDNTYTLTEDDIDCTITATAASADSNYSGSVTGSVAGEVGKAAQTAPDAPVLASRTADSITLTAIPDSTVSGAAAEYSRDGGKTWQTSPVFTGLTAGTDYTFLARYQETDCYRVSPDSIPVVIRTGHSSTGGGGGGGSTGGGSVSRPAYPPDVSDSEYGETELSPSNPKEGDTVTIMPDPEEGFAADRVTVTDQDGNPVEITENGDGTWSFIQPDSSVTISVTYRQIEEELPFRDVSEDAWYEGSVRYVYENGLMVGTSDTEFHPDVTTSRSMLVTTLWRMAGNPSAGGPITFDDVNEEAWYAEAVRWAAGEGIVNGYSSSTFAPDDTLTREQMAAMLHRFAGYMGYDISGAADLSGYSDTEEISGYAAQALSWAGAEGLINGMSDTVLAPKGSATRAQMAAILMRFCERYEDAG